MLHVIVNDVEKALTEYKQRGETDLMLGLRLSGMVQGLEIGGSITSEQATKLIITVKNDMNF